MHVALGEGSPIAEALRHDRGVVALVLMAAAGVAISAYLTAAHYAAAELVCTQGGIVDCAAVTTSSYSVVPGTDVPISLTGLAWFVVSGGLALARDRVPWARPAHLAWTIAGTIVVLYLVDAEIRVIGRICEWCTALHVLIAGSFFVALSRATAPRD